MARPSLLAYPEELYSQQKINGASIEGKAIPLLHQAHECAHTYTHTHPYYVHVTIEVAIILLSI